MYQAVPRYPLRDISDQFAMERPGQTTFQLRRKSPEELYQEGLEKRIRQFRSRPDLIKVQLGGKAKPQPEKVFDDSFDLASLDDGELLSRELDDYFTSLYSFK